MRGDVSRATIIKHYWVAGYPDILPHGTKSLLKLVTPRVNGPLEFHCRIKFIAL